MKLSFAKPGLPRTGIVVVGVFATRDLCPSGVKLIKSLDGALSRAMRASRFMGNKGQTFILIRIEPLRVWSQLPLIRYQGQN